MKTMWNDELIRLFLTNRMVLKAHFSNKSAPKEGLRRVYQRMLKENPDLCDSKHLTPVSMASKWKHLSRSCRDYNDTCNQCGAGACSIKEPPYYEEVMECMDTGGRVGVKGPSFHRDRSSGLKRTSLWDDDDDDILDDSPEDGRISPDDDNAEGEDDEMDPDEQIANDKNYHLPEKRLSKRERLAEKAAGKGVIMLEKVDEMLQKMDKSADRRFEEWKENVAATNEFKAKQRSELLKQEREQKIFDFF